VHPEQADRWIPPLARGERIGAIAMTEPAAGRDLQGIRTTARRDGDELVINGAKTFVTNGIQSDLVIVAARTAPGPASRRISLIVVERGTRGFSRGRKLDKMGLAAQDTAELFFDEARVPVSNLLGQEGKGFEHLMERLPRERLGIAVMAVAATSAALDWTVAYTRERSVFDRPLATLQNTQFELAAAVTEFEVLQAYVEKATLALNVGRLSAVDAAKAKLWSSEVQNRIVDRCLQLFGGYSYMNEYPIARAYTDARVQRIYGGTSEIMKTIIGRDATGMR
jgi:alkylation response protein AidB-like acyl-CoA dehydrogenase